MTKKSSPQALNKKEKGGGLGSPGGEDSEHEQVLWQPCLVSHWVSHWVGTTLLPNRKVIFVVCCSYAFAMLLPFGCLSPNHSKFEFAQNLSKSHHATNVFTGVGLCSILSFMLIYRSCYIWSSPFSKQSNWSLTYIWSSFIGLKNSIGFDVSMS